MIRIIRVCFCAIHFDLSEPFGRGHLFYKLLITTSLIALITSRPLLLLINRLQLLLKFQIRRLLRLPVFPIAAFPIALLGIKVAIIGRLLFKGL